MQRFFLVFSCLSCLSWPALSLAQDIKPGEPLAGTRPLTMEGDIAAQMVAGIDKFLLREIDLSVERREKHWKRDFSSPEAYNKSIEPNRQRLAKILGVVDERVKFDAPELVGTTKQSAIVGKGTPTFDYVSPIPERYAFLALGVDGVRDAGRGIAGWAPIQRPDGDRTLVMLIGVERRYRGGLPAVADLAAAKGLSDSALVLDATDARTLGFDGTLRGAHAASSELVVEWRALTIALLDRLAAELRRRLGLDAERLPLAKVLEGGTWAAGRRLAAELRQGAPPLVVESDGTLF